jgi:hypothetical protein
MSSELQPPKLPSCKNMGLAVRISLSDGYRDVDEATEGGNVTDIVLFGLSLGVSKLAPLLRPCLALAG